MDETIHFDMIAICIHQTGRHRHMHRRVFVMMVAWDGAHSTKHFINIKNNKKNTHK